MKKTIITVCALVCMICASACDDKSGDNKSILALLSGSGGTGETNRAGDMLFHNADGAGFIMAYVPAKSFRTGTDDEGSATVAQAFWIGDTEVTYELWYTVRQWALLNGYVFSHTGIEGHDGADGGVVPETMEPVTMINWRDALVWSNAATEWHNARVGTGYTCAYYSDPAYTMPIRTSTDAEAMNMAEGSEDRPYILAAASGNLDAADCTATGFRLLTSDEWELAARYIDDINNDGDISDPGEYYPGSFASGAMADYRNAGANQTVAWYSANSDRASHPVEGLFPNALGLYDMNGNVWEWCFTLHSTLSGPRRRYHGGHWLSEADRLQVGYVASGSPANEVYSLGFRLARTE